MHGYLCLYTIGVWDESLCNGVLLGYKNPQWGNLMWEYESDVRIGWLYLIVTSETFITGWFHACWTTSNRFVEALKSLRSWLSRCSSYIGYETCGHYTKGFINNKKVKYFGWGLFNFFYVCFIHFSSPFLFVFGDDHVICHTGGWYFKWCCWRIEPKWEQAWGLF